MRKKIVAGNWKMNTNLEAGIKLASEINEKVSQEIKTDIGIVIAPPFTHLSEIRKVIDNDRICLAAQNCATEPKGAYTGEVSAKMLQSVGVKAVILGHSERRQYYHETTETLKSKIERVLENNMKIIYCCGEMLEERQQKIHFTVVESHIKLLFDLPKEAYENIIIAYEPVWAIGTGVVAKPEEAQEMHSFIRNRFSMYVDKEIAEKLTILYGGSCNPTNAKELFANNDIDGGLIGGASLNADDFLRIIKAF